VAVQIVAESLEAPCRHFQVLGTFTMQQQEPGLDRCAGGQTDCSTHDGTILKHKVPAFGPCLDTFILLYSNSCLVVTSEVLTVFDSVPIRPKIGRWSGF
jgi:hypothetical protein